MTRLGLLASMLIITSTLTACGKPEGRPTVSQALSQFAPAASYAGSEKVVQKRMLVSGCLYEHQRGIINLRHVIRISKADERSLRFMMMGHFHSEYTETWGTTQDREDAYVRAINGWSNCLNGYNATTEDHYETEQSQ